MLVATPAARTLTQVSCELGRDGLNPQLSRCLATGREFLKIYMKKVHRARRKSFDRCRSVGCRCPWDQRVTHFHLFTYLSYSCPTVEHKASTIYLSYSCPNVEHKARTTYCQFPISRDLLAAVPRVCHPSNLHVFFHGSSPGCFLSF